MMKGRAKLSRFLGRVIRIVVVVVALIWLRFALPDQDWLWFLPVFDEQATRIYLYRNGETIILQSGDEGYDEVNEAINETVRSVETKSALKLSLEFQQEYYEQFSAVEAFYSEPVIIHTRHGFPKADKYLFPQSGLHHDPPVVFGGMQSQPDYRGGILVLASRDLLDEAVDAVWVALRQD